MGIVENVKLPLHRAVINDGGVCWTAQRQKRHTKNSGDPLHARRFLRQPSKPIAPSPVASSGSDAGKGVTERSTVIVSPT